jgi:hypothetical protein
MASRLLSAALLATRALSTPIPSNVQCGNLSVPIDWDVRKGETFNLGMVRLLRPSNSTTKRLASLFINPGGPGASASRYVASLGSSILTDILNSYDIIGAELRGVGLGSPVQCDADI